MLLKIDQFPHTEWVPLPRKGCVRVEYKPLLKLEHLALVQLRFGKEAHIDEHVAQYEIDVICLEGGGYVSVGDENARFRAGDRVRWPAGELHQLWTMDEDEMVTLMVEHVAERPVAKQQPDEPKKTAVKPQWEDADSSMISAFKYHPETQELEVMFKRTGVYRYFEVPADVVQGLRDADSKGSYMRWAIINMFGYEKL